jgi:hypothetical protein
VARAVVVLLFGFGACFFVGRKMSHRLNFRVFSFLIDGSFLLLPDQVESPSTAAVDRLS